MLNFVIDLPTPSASDVESRELAVSVGGDQLPVTMLDGMEIVSPTFSGDQEVAVHVELVDIDDAGNRSQASVLDAVLVDTIAPPQPGQMGIRVTGET